MKNRILHSILIVLMLTLVSGCSTKKNTRVSRTFHNVTSHYNIYFNANESLKAGEARIEKMIEDDYTRVLPIYKDSDPSAAKLANADMENIILKSSKLIKVHSITKRLKRKKGKKSKKYMDFASKEEFNKWIDDSYLLMGKAYFYQDKFISAIDNFSYVVRKFSQEETKYDAFLWLIRSYTEMERYAEASELIQSLQGDDAFPKRLERDFAIITADYYMQQNDYAEAIKYLDIAVNKTFWKKQKARLTFIAAQLYQELGDYTNSSNKFREVTKLNAPYKMAFNARINAAGVYTGQGDTEKLKKELGKMLRDKKNTEFQDQIYYALGNIFFKEGNSELAVENFRSSVSTSVSNDFQLALSAITLADIYFDHMEYRNSQAYYDSAMVVIDENYPNHKNITIRYNNLTQLVENLVLVEREDSLQKIALMEPAERNALIDEMIAAEEEKQQQLDLAASGVGGNNAGFYRANENRFGLGSTSTGGGWYFYNPQTVSYGKNQFQQLWGRRKLEDNWRRANKGSNSVDLLDEFGEPEEEEEMVVRIEDPLKREYYTQDLPLTDSLMTASHDKIKDALYNAGKIFKSEFSNYERSIEAFEDLNERYPDNVYVLSAYFDLYDLNELLGDKSRSDYYRNLIIQRYPDSKYAKYLLNPNFFIDLEMQKDSLNRLYQYTFSKYNTGQYAQVVTLTSQMNDLEPDSIIIPKIDFLRTVALGVQAKNMQSLEAGLRGYTEKYPKKETTILAEQILSLIEDSTLADYQKLVELGYLNDEIQNEELKAENTNINDEFGGKFDYDEDLLHYFIVAYPRSAEVDVNRLKFDIANYNIDHYTKIDFDIETENLDNKTAFLIVRALSSKQNSLIYFRSIIRQSEVFQALTDVDYINIVASSSNYRAILADKSLSDYLRFFVKNYSRFIGSNFEDEEFDNISPEEMMAKVEEQEDALEEQGTFVLVNKGVEGSIYNNNVDTSQCFVLAVQNAGNLIRPVLSKFSTFNTNNFRTWNLALQLKKSGDYQLLVVKGLPGFSEGMSYFRTAIMDRGLYEGLEQVSYRNFLITYENLDVLTSEGDVNDYMNFFRNEYLQSAAANSGTSTSVQTNALTQVQAESVQTQQDDPEVSVVVEDGTYNPDVEKAHLFAFVIPSEDVSTQLFLNGIETFNNTNFASLNLELGQQALDEFRTIVKISGLKDKDIAMQYFRQLVRDRSIYAPLGNANYRNFLITEENFDTFLKEKNITEYMDFYKRVYLGQ